MWERSWQRVFPFFDFPEEIHKIIYTTNAVESLHMTMRKVTKNRGSKEPVPRTSLFLAENPSAEAWNPGNEGFQS